MDIVNFDALTANNRIIDPSQVDPNEDYFILGKYTNHYTTNSQKYTKYPVYAIKAGDVMGGYVPPYKVYTALLTQDFNNPPVAKVLENTLGGNILWTYDQAGVYIGTLTGAFTVNKTAGIISGVATGTAKVYRKNDNEVYVQTRDFLGVPTDNKLEETTIEIRVYN